MLTIFSTPRPFEGVFAELQRNAIRSWLALTPRPQVILIQDEKKTTSAVAQEFGVDCIEEIEKNENGSLYLDDTFRKVGERAKYGVLAQINTDILVFQDLIDAVEGVTRRFPGPFYLVGQRHNLDVKEALHFETTETAKRIRAESRIRGELHPVTGMDYWIFRKELSWAMPKFIVGRPAADSWLIQRARELGLPTIDATPVVTIIHQNHPRPTSSDRIFTEETEYNRRICKGPTYREEGPNCYFTTADAQFILYPGGEFASRKFSFREMLRYRYDPAVVSRHRTLWRLFYLVYNRVWEFARASKRLVKRGPLSRPSNQTE
jgi:hypothetical protein